MCEVIIYTPAYNAEKTLRRTVDSVLAQTHTDFIYYLLDNAATDGTGAIIREYADRDGRIVPLYNETNYSGNWVLDVIENHSGDSYFCMLDADDEYTPDFLEKMLAFMREYRLEVAACGNDFIDALTNSPVGVRKPEQDLILDDISGFNKHFRQYHQFMRTVWGKMYTVSVLRKYKPGPILRYGGDTLFVLETFRNAGRVGLLAESLHKYYIYPKSVSYQFDEKRIASDQILFDKACEFLALKCGKVSRENMNFLFHVYLNAIRDTMRILLDAQISISEKLLSLREIFHSRQTQELLQWTGAAEQKDELLRQAAVWVLSQAEARTSANLEIAADILAAMGMYPTRAGGWQDGQVFLLLTEIKDRLRKKETSENKESGNKDSTANVDAQIVSVASGSPLLSGLDGGFLTYFRDIVFSILQNNEKKALEQIEETIAREPDIPDEYVEHILALGLKLSTKLEYTGDFIYFKKLQISLLIDLSRTDEARDELADWDEVLPDDMDFKKFRKRLAG